MSKIDISMPNKVRPNLIALFHEYLSNKPNDENDYGEDYASWKEYWDQVFPGWDDYDDDDVCTVYPLLGHNKSSNDGLEDCFGINCGKRNKKKHGKSKNKKGKVIDIDIPFDGEEEEYVKYSNEFKEIWFYLDYHDKNNRLEFNNFNDFERFCDEQGYFIPHTVCDDIEYRYESHCCLDPKSKKVGFLEVICGHSYGDMFYEVCDDVELGYE